MAISIQNYLREAGVLEKLSQNNRNYSNVSESKNIFTVFEQRMFIWHDGGSCLLVVDLKPGIANKKDHQVLMLTNPPVFEVDCLLLNRFGTLLALVGRSGVMVVVVPGYGKLSQSEKNTNFFCRSWNVAERFFVCSSRVSIMQAAWHPGSPANTHLIILSTDDYLRIYDVYDPQTPYQVASLSSSSKCYLSTEAKDSFSYCLGESAVSFDFGPPEASEISDRNNEWGKTSSANIIIWPIFVLHGNGDVCLVKLSMEKARSQLIKVEGPLAMYPAADDNYGVDACSLICLHSNPPVLVIATSSGVLYHCLLLDNSGNGANEEFRDDKAWTAYRPTGSYSSGDLALYVCESVELSLSLITEVLEDACCYPIRLHKDPTTCSRYHCTHVSGVHTVALPFIQFLEECLDKDDFSTWIPQLEEKKCIVEHLLCTQPLAEVDVVPVLGLSVTVTDTGAVVICLLATWEFASLPLVSSYHSSSPSLLSSRGNISERILLENHEQSFEKHVHQLLHRSTTTPMLKSDISSDGTKSPQQWLELVCNVTQRLREEYVQRLHTVQTEIERRKKILLHFKQQQLLEIERCTKEKDFLQNGVEQLAEKYEDACTKQQALLKRVENVLQHLQRRLPILSDAEINMKKDLLSLEEKIKFYENSVEHIHAKQIYQSQKMKEFETPQRKITTDTVSLGTSQLKHLKEILLQEGESISELVKTVCSLMKEVGI